MFDVVVAGAGPAGSATAIKYGQRGLRVALLERSPDPQHFKRACTHEIQAAAVGLLDELGLSGELAGIDARRTSVVLRTPYGWVRPDSSDGFPHPHVNFNARRETLDPLLRRRAAETPGVELMAGQRVEDVIRAGSRVRGVVARDRAGRTTRLSAQLVVGADGTESRVAQAAGVAKHSNPHGRFGYWAYFEDVDLPFPPDGHVWFLDPDIAYALPTDGGQTLVSIVPTHDRLGEFKSDPQRLFWSIWSDLPEGPPIDRMRQVSPFYGRKHYNTLVRRAAGRGVALVGDAARTVDYVWGWGLAWALQSAAWLVDATAAPMLARRGLDRGLLRYRTQMGLRLTGHLGYAASYATGRRFTPPERLLYTLAARNNEVAKQMVAFSSLSAGPAGFLNPALALRVGRDYLEPLKGALVRREVPRGVR